MNTLDQSDREAWVVNTLKIRLISKLDHLLEKEGRENARKLFLVPVFTLGEFIKRIETHAPEMKTFVFKELNSLLEKN